MALAFSALVILLGAITVLKVQPIFLQIFKDFGSELPAFTRLTVNPWFVIVLSLLPLGFSVVAILSNAPRATRLATLAFSLFLAIALPVLVAMGLYLPIFQIAGNIK